MNLVQNKAFGYNYNFILDILNNPSMKCCFKAIQTFTKIAGIKLYFFRYF